MILVERAVRPVRAGGRRKLTMRQELLGHLTARFDEERARLGDDAAALAETARRFGDPAEVTRELQGAVPVLERVLNAPVPGLHRLERRARGPGGHWNLSATKVAALCAGVSFLAVLLPLYLARVSAAPDWADIGLSAGVMAALAGAAFAVTYFVYRLCQVVSEPGGTATARRAVWYGVAAVAVQVLSTLALTTLLFHSPDQAFVRLPRVIVVTVVVVVLLPLATRFVATRRRRYAEWLGLEIGE
jgi:hypothetical protein